MDIRADVDYTCYDNSSLYVVSPVAFGEHLKYDSYICALQV